MSSLFPRRSSSAPEPQDQDVVPAWLRLGDTVSLNERESLCPASELVAHSRPILGIEGKAASPVAYAGASKRRCSTGDDARKRPDQRAHGGILQPHADSQLEQRMAVFEAV